MNELLCAVLYRIIILEYLGRTHNTVFYIPYDSGGLYSTYFMSMSAVTVNFRPLSLTDRFRMDIKDRLGARGRLDYMEHSI